MKTLTLPIYNIEGREIDTMTLDPSIFDTIVNTAAIYQEVCVYRANQRKGLASTKTRGEVSGGGRKPWRQKGTGRARVGSIRSPLWRHGGVIFGPHPRDYSYAIPKKINKLALRSALCIKVKENNFIILDNFKIEKPNTKEAVKIFSNLKINPVRNTRALREKDKISNGIKPLKSILLLLDRIDSNLKRALSNINFLDVNLARQTHTYEVLAHQKLIITRQALSELTERLKK